ncbi:MarR family winged helix-turn-helix transcriptional regulator [Streptosporangium sp. NBC_01756]|uniref:MarR family winged helix-turn-helix transcriptional regulator n=1 Tax=Streptosporangium sp. NBC_01756 TaxID=2975950 RepID=UPI002DD82859|nr:MarR family winged helix-turn-helix transcriptional regulator [Streptosporangium sp. NBC_01756]WSC86683.1 MarR family winged helix-turn-helix transcriptional regulator [Streptosporangium sp. NBC_01756]
MENPSEKTPAKWESLPSWLLTQTANHAHRLVTDGFSSACARGYHYRLLATLEESGPASQAALGRRSGIHVSDMVATINELADRKLVERAPDLSDRRRNVISLTAPGKRQLRRLEKQLAECQDELLAPLSPDERQQLTGLLSKLLDHHNRRTDTPEESWR